MCWSFYCVCVFFGSSVPVWVSVPPPCGWVSFRVWRARFVFLFALLVLCSFGLGLFFCLVGWFFLGSFGVVLWLLVLLLLLRLSGRLLLRVLFFFLAFLRLRCVLRLAFRLRVSSLLGRSSVLTVRLSFRSLLRLAVLLLSRLFAWLRLFLLRIWLRLLPRSLRLLPLVCPAFRWLPLVLRVVVLLASSVVFPLWLRWFLARSPRLSPAPSLSFGLAGVLRRGSPSWGSPPERLWLSLSVLRFVSLRLAVCFSLFKSIRSIL